MQFCGIHIAIVCPILDFIYQNISPRFYLSCWLSSHHLAALICAQIIPEDIYRLVERNDDRRFGNTSGRISTVLTIRIWGEFTRKEEEEEEGEGGFIRAINRKDPRMALWRFPRYITALDKCLGRRTISELRRSS